jgi:tetratricopeptide (TPR) repeat protein
MKMSRRLCAILLTPPGLTAAGQSFAGIPQEALQLQREWARINYEVPEKERADAMAELVASCEGLSATRPAVETLIWCGIVRSTYAGMASPFSAMKYAKAARKDFEKAIEMDGEALSGSAYTSLGTLYFKVPGWPVGFGSDGEAEKYLQKGLAINPDGIDPNYFYGEYLFEQGDYAKSREHLVRAQNAPPRPDRPVADRGRHRDIEALMSEVEKKTDS